MKKERKLAGKMVSEPFTAFSNTVFQSNYSIKYSK
jgi:hypothetical protein